MKIQITSPTSSTELTVQRPHGMNFGLQLVMKNRDSGEELAMDLDQQDTEALEKGLGLFT